MASSRDVFGHLEMLNALPENNTVLYYDEHTSRLSIYNRAGSGTLFNSNPTGNGGSTYNQSGAHEHHHHKKWSCW